MFRREAARRRIWRSQKSICRPTHEPESHFLLTAEEKWSFSACGWLFFPGTCWGKKAPPPAALFSPTSTSQLLLPAADDQDPFPGLMGARQRAGCREQDTDLTGITRTRREKRSDPLVWNRENTVLILILNIISSLNRIQTRVVL